jgi:tetratricopeptide (TPR) repeat protein
LGVNAKLRRTGQSKRAAEKKGYLLEDAQIFSASLLWDLQRRYFAEKGVEAWRQGEVPHYVTSNPTVANCYAEIVFAFLRDQERLARGQRSEQPLYICELGAGAGRFAFHFLKQLTYLCDQAGLARTTFRYVLTDVAQSNLAFWRSHPRFQPFFAEGVLDLAEFDVLHADRMTLQLSGQTLTPGSLERPVVIFANYVFDSIPSELYYLDDKRCYQCLTSLFLDDDPRQLDPVALLPHLKVHYDYQAFTETSALEPELQPLLTYYRRMLNDTHLLFPAAGLRCLQRLRALSQHGLLLLSADKGDVALTTLRGKALPDLVHHGSFSLNVNYHAFKIFCEQHGGMALLPRRRREHVNVVSLLLLDQAAGYRETQDAYQRQVQDFGPDDFYNRIKQARERVAEMSAAEILAQVRLSHYDSHQFGRYFLPRLLELAPTLDSAERQAVREVVANVWETYFPLGEELDLADQIARLLYALDDYSQAINYLERSMKIYGPYTGTLSNLAACYQLVGQPERAQTLLHTVLKYDPTNELAGTVLGAECQLKS